MLRVAIRGLLAHKLRFLLTTLAVVLGVTFVAGSFVLTDSMESAFGELFESSSAGVDLHVRAATGFEMAVTDFDAGAAPTLDERVVDEARTVEGVAEAVGYVEGMAAFIAPDGEAIIPQGPPTLALSWTGGRADGPLHVRSGRGPEAAGEVMMDAGTFERFGFVLGQEVEVAGPAGVASFTLVGVSGFGESDNLLGATIASFELDTARELLGKQGRFDEIAILVDDGADAAAVRERLSAELGPDVTVVTAADRAAADQADVGAALGFLTTALLAFAGISVFVGAFLIANTFSIVVAQRMREFALLRAVGASQRQVRGAILIEAVLVGLVASTLGLVLGIGLARLLPVMLSAAGIELPTTGIEVAPRTVVAAFLVGTVVTVVSAVLPARRASRVAPVEAMRGAVIAQRSSLRRRTIVGVVLTTLGGVGVVVGLAGEVPEPLAVVGLGAAVTFLGVTLLSPLLADPLARSFGWLPARLSVPGKLARGNARRDPRRTAVTASALMIGLALVSTVTIFTASLQTAVTDALGEQFRADFIVQAAGVGPAGLPRGLAGALHADPAIGEVSPIRTGQIADADGAVQSVAAVDPVVIEDLIALGVSSGDLTALDGDAIALHDEVADARGLTVGDRFPAVLLDGTGVDLEVVATFGSVELIGSGYLLSLEGLDRGAAPAGDLVLLANAAADVDSARLAVEDALATAPGATVRDQVEFRELQEEQVAQLLGLLLALLALAVVIALLGITNTLALAVLERTREIGLLRAVGMDRAQTRRMVLWESVLVASFGALLGVVVGVFLGWALVGSLADEGVGRLVVPVGRLGVYVVAAIVAGLVAAVLPAIRAARLDVLRAVTVE
jgi:putative ABC transport system permease protein